RRDQHDVRGHRLTRARNRRAAHARLQTLDGTRELPRRIGVHRGDRWIAGMPVLTAAERHRDEHHELVELQRDCVQLPRDSGAAAGRPDLRSRDGHRRRVLPGAARGSAAGGAGAQVKVTALAAHTPEAVRAALAARGWETQPAWFAATGIQPLVVLIEDTTEDEREALVHWAAKSGADVLTGEGWALLAGAASRLSPLARYDRAPAELRRLAPALGRVLAARAEPPRVWTIGVAQLLLVKPVVLRL